MRPKYLQSVEQAKELCLDDGFVSKVVDVDTKQIVGYIEGTTFSGSALRAVNRSMRVFLLHHPDDVSDGLKMFGVNLKTALMSLDSGLVRNIYDFTDEYLLREILYAEVPDDLREAARAVREINDVVDNKPGG